MAEENVFVGTNCQSFDPSKIQCDKEGNMPIHVLDKYCEENDTRYNIFPATIVQAVFDGITGTRLDRLLAICNSVYLTWEGTFADTVNKLDKIYRRKGYIITYRDATNVNWTRRFNSDDISDAAWSDNNNWEGWSFDTIIEDLAKAIEEIFKNIGEYKEFLEVLIGYVNQFVIDIFENLQNYSDLINIIKNTTIESLPIVVKDIFNNINNYPELKNLFDQYIQRWTIEIFNNITAYPELNQFITNAINTRVETVVNSIFNNIDTYPQVKNLIVNNTINKVVDIFKNIGQYPELKQAIQNNVNERVDYIFNNINEFPELIGILSDLVCNCVKNIFNNINDYPTLITCINNATNSRVDYIFNNIDRFPLLKNLIETKVEARVTYVFEHVNDFAKLLEVIKGNIEVIFDNINNHPALKLVIENKTTAVVENILANINDYPNIKTTFTNFINTVINTRRGQANGIAELDADGKVPSNQLPSYVDDVLEGVYADSTHFIENTIDDAPIYYTPEKGKIYVDISEGNVNSGKTYRWSGTQYVVISETIVIGEVEGTAYDGAKGKQTTDIVNSLPDNICYNFDIYHDNTDSDDASLYFIVSKYYFDTNENIYKNNVVHGGKFFPKVSNTKDGVMTPDLYKKLVTDIPTQIESIINSTYTKSEIDTKLTEIPSKDTIYTKAEVDKAITDAIAALVPNGYELVIKKKTE